MSCDTISTVLAWFFDANGLIFELLISVALFSAGLQRRTHFVRRVVVMILLLTIISSLWAYAIEPSMWTAIARFLLLVGMMWGASLLCWTLGKTSAAFVLVMAAGMQHFVFRSATMLTSLVTSTLWLAPDVEMFIYPLALVPFFVTGYYFFARPLRRIQIRTVGNRAVLLLLAGMLLSVNVFTNVFEALDPVGGGAMFVTFSLLDLITCIFLLSLSTQILHRESAEQDSKILAQLLHQQKTRLESSKETIELINIKTHDMKRQIALLGDRIPQDEVDELHKLVGIYDTLTPTGNEALDVLLAERTLIGERRGIRFERTIDGELLDFMKPGEIYSLFGNAIDNAMDAVAAVADESRRYIVLDVRRRKGMLAIHVENSFEGERRFDGDLPITTKSDPRHHGFGVRSIQMIAQRYGGYLFISTHRKVFTLDVLLPLPHVFRAHPIE